MGGQDLKYSLRGWAVRGDFSPMRGSYWATKTTTRRVDSANDGTENDRETAISVQLSQENEALKHKIDEMTRANHVFLASFRSLSADRQELLRYKAAEV